MNTDRYPELYEDFENEIDIGFSNIEDMGHASPDKVKSKYLKVKKDLITVRNNWKRSGNGEGKLQRNEQNLAESYIDEEIRVDANDKRNFLGGNSKAILYAYDSSMGQLECHVPETQNNTN